MTTFFLTILLFAVSNSVKIWIPNTDINTVSNWDKNDVPKDCDNIRFEAQTEVSAYWNVENLAITGLSLPMTGDIIFPHNVKIQFRDKEKCPQSRDLKYIRHSIKGWLDPYNWWKPISETGWLPHSERIPCAGEAVVFPPQNTFAVQLPDVLIPIGSIVFDTEVYRGDEWSDFLRTELGFQFFKGPDDIRSLPWRDDVGCSNNKKCICGRSPYSIRDGRYRETDPSIFQEAVCLYAMPKCEPSPCYSPVVPEGHCCGICGAVIKLEDKTKEGLNIKDLKATVTKELKKYDSEKKLKTYVGRTRDENVQIVVVAENSEDTINSHNFANLIRRKLTEKNLHARISSHVSGLRFSNYVINGVSGAVFGTLLAVLALFATIYYVYLLLPQKKFPSSGAGSPFMFARFENIVNEENLEIGVEAKAPQELPQAFDNPMYSGHTESGKECGESSTTDSKLGSETSPILDPSSTKEYNNPIYSELEETKQSGEFFEDIKSDEEEFSEVKL